MNYKTRQPFPHAAYVEGQRNFTYFDRSLTSGLTDEIISSPGDFLYIDQASTGVVSVELNMRQGGTLAPILLAAGGSIECDFASIKINATAQLNKTVRVIVGNGARVKGGANVNASSMSVSVVDGGKLRTVAENAFLGQAYSAAVAGQYSHSQLFNPANSGVNAFVEKISFSLAAASIVYFGNYNTALTTNHGGALCKKIDGRLSSSLLKAEQSAALLITNTFLITSGSTALTVLELTEPILIPPGKGLVLVNTNSNQFLYANFEFFEE